jgi:hypothetical protein
MHEAMGKLPEVDGTIQLCEQSVVTRGVFLGHPTPGCLEQDPGGLNLLPVVSVED